MSGPLYLSIFGCLAGIVFILSLISSFWIEQEERERERKKEKEKRKCDNL